jgi:hypothetical protein
MSADDPEVIPPGTRLPDVRGDRGALPARQEQPLTLRTVGCLARETKSGRERDQPSALRD